MTPGPAVAQQLGPMGINVGQVISDVNTATSEFKGVTVPVHLTVDPETKKVDIKVLSPPTSELIKKEMKLEKASSERLKQRVGNMAIEQVISVAKAKHDSMLSNDFMATVKSVIGTCQALGIMVESKETKEVLEEIAEGKYKAEIEAQKTDVAPEKRKELDTFFKNVEAEQEALKKAEEEEAAAAEAAKAAEAAEAAEGEEAPAEGEEAPAEGEEAPAEGEAPAAEESKE
jgi:large subunit ribosomal protein L11